MEAAFEKTMSSHECRQRSVTGAPVVQDPLCYTAAITAMGNLHMSGELPQTGSTLNISLHMKLTQSLLMVDVC